MVEAGLGRKSKKCQYKLDLSKLHYVQTQYLAYDRELLLIYKVVGY
jgi:hypothetical protein